MRGRLGELAGLCLKLGIIGFGGPAAHIAMLRDEVVERRKWLDADSFLDLVGATNLIPGPNSTEMVMHVGLLRSGWMGLIVAGVCFVLPACVISGVFGWVYVRWGTVEQVRPFFDGIPPVVLVVILAALWKMGKSAVKSWHFAVPGIAVLAVCELTEVGEVPALLAGGVVGMIWLRLVGRGSARPAATLLTLGAVGGAGLSAKAKVALASGGAAAAGGAAAGGITLWGLGLVFLKVGAVLYGTGYVLVAFLNGELVEQRGWLTPKELIDAIAIGQFTPGPLLSTASFIGFLRLGAAGAAVATLGMFLPSFVFVALLRAVLEKLRKSAWMRAFLDAVNVCAVGLMVHAMIRLGAGTMTSWRPILLAALVVPLVFGLKVNAAWLVLGGAVAGWALSYLV